MPRQRHRMRSRRGSSRGRSTRPTSTPTHEPETHSSSPSSDHSRDHLSGRYPKTHSGRGRAQDYGARRTNAATQTTGPLDSLHPSYHTTQFHFHSMLHRPAIIATVTVAFNEELRPQDEQAAKIHEPGTENGQASKQPKAEETRDISGPEDMDRKIATLRHKDGHDSTLHGKDIAGGKHATDGWSGDTQEVGGSQGGTTAAVEEREDYGCRIVEESVDKDDYGCHVMEEPPPDA